MVRRCTLLSGLPLLQLLLRRAASLPVPLLLLILPSSSSCSSLSVDAFQQQIRHICKGQGLFARVLPADMQGITAAQGRLAGCCTLARQAGLRPQPEGELVCAKNTAAAVRRNAAHPSELSSRACADAGPQLSSSFAVYACRMQCAGLYRLLHTTFK
jgi:hypothetical protein